MQVLQNKMHLLARGIFAKKKKVEFFSPYISCQKYFCKKDLWKFLKQLPGHLPVSRLSHSWLAPQEISWMLVDHQDLNPWIPQ